MKFNGLLSVLFVPKCVSCGVRVPPERTLPLCDKCCSIWETEKKTPCPVCGHDNQECRCGLIYDTRHCIDADVHLSSYTSRKDSVTKDMILCLKRKAYPPLFSMIADDLRMSFISRQGMRSEYTVVNVPRSSFAVREHGFDQAALLSDAFSAVAGFDRAEPLRHTGNTVQKKLDHKERIENARKSYGLSPEAKSMVKGKNVILIDDIVTTGATASRCAYLLKRAGASHVVLMYIARAY